MADDPIAKFHRNYAGKPEEKDKSTLNQARPTYSGKMPPETIAHHIARNIHDGESTPDNSGADKALKESQRDMMNMATGGSQADKPTNPMVPSYKHGTSYVPKTGPALLHEGEKVVPAKENKMEHTPEEKAHFARSMHKLHGGALHRHFGIAEDKPIPMEKKQEAANSDNPHVAAMGRMAVAMHGWKKK